MQLDIPTLKEIFGIRNKMIHELDIDLTARARNRRVRSPSDLLENAAIILSTTNSIVAAVNAIPQYISSRWSTRVTIESPILDPGVRGPLLNLDHIRDRTNKC